MSDGAANGVDIRITEVIAHPLSQTLPKPTVTSWGKYTEVSICLVEIRTDSGITGVGEALARFSPKAYAELIETSLRPRLVGQNPTDITAHWHSMRRALSGRSGGMLFEAIAGVDIALWDILGKVAGLPIYRLLGGMGRSQVPVYAASVNWGDDEFMDRELDRYLEKGFPRIKVKVANRDLYGADFVWVDESQITRREEPAEAVVIERTEWGLLIGTLKEVRDAGRAVEIGRASCRERV